MTPKPFTRRPTAPKRELVPAKAIAEAVEGKVSPAISAALAGAKVSLFASLLALIVSGIALLHSC